MSIVFSADEDCVEGWLRAFRERRILDERERAAVEAFAALVRADLAADPVTGWSDAHGATMRASGRPLRLARPGGARGASPAHPFGSLGGFHRPGGSIESIAAMPVTHRQDAGDTRGLAATSVTGRGAE